MLTLTLRHLEHDGIVERTADRTVPVTVEYCLTPFGTTLIHSVIAFVRWTAEHEREIAAARSRYNARLEEPKLLGVRDVAASHKVSWPGRNRVSRCADPPAATRLAGPHGRAVGVDFSPAAVLRIARA